MICAKRNKIFSNFVIEILPLYNMAKKGTEKNTKNKAKHNKLMARKKNKLKAHEALRKERLKAIIAKANAQKHD